MGYDLWPRPYRLQSFAGGLMRISQEIRRGVVFIGLCDPSTNNFEAKGTGFFERYDEWVYLVTVQHIAAGLGDSPFAIRINKRDGSSANIHVDPLMGGAKWYSNLVVRRRQLVPTSELGEPHGHCRRLLTAGYLPTASDH